MTACAGTGQIIRQFECFYPILRVRFCDRFVTGFAALGCSMYGALFQQIIVTLHTSFLCKNLFGKKETTKDQKDEFESPHGRSGSKNRSVGRPTKGHTSHGQVVRKRGANWQDRVKKRRATVTRLR
jgi:hypothetical protein